MKQLIEAVEHYGWDYSTPGVLIHPEKGVTITKKEEIDNVITDCILRKNDEDSDIEKAKEKAAKNAKNMWVIFIVIGMLAFLIKACASS